MEDGGEDHEEVGEWVEIDEEEYYYYVDGYWVVSVYLHTVIIIEWFQIRNIKLFNMGRLISLYYYEMKTWLL